MPLNLNTNFDGLTKLKNWWNVVKSNFTAIQSAYNAHVDGTGDRHTLDKIDYTSGGTDMKTKYDGHLDGTLNRHSSNDTDNDSDVDGANLTEVANNLKGEIDNLVVGASNTTIGVFSLSDTTHTNDYTGTFAGVSAYFSGFKVNLTVTNSNTGASTLNVNSIGIKYIKVIQSNGTKRDVISGEVAGKVTLEYDGTDFILTSSYTKFDAHLADNPSVRDFDSIQTAIDSTTGMLNFPAGLYEPTSTITIKYDTIIDGAGAGAYFSGSGYDRITVIRPTADFEGDEIFRADPADYSSELSYTYGIAIKNIVIDMINVKNSEKTAIKLMSLSNTETFENIRIINNNNGIALHIGISENESALPSDGLVFSNIYTLPDDNDINTINPVLKIESGNEISFRDCKFQGASLPTVVTGSKSVYISAITDSAINAVTFDSCSFTGSESSVYIEGKTTDGQGPRWIRINNCTFEGFKYGIKMKGSTTRPVQFCAVGTGNRFISMLSGGKSILLEEYASNNQIFGDELSSIQINANAVGNLVYGFDYSNFTNNGTNNGLITRQGAGIRTNQLYTEGWISPTLGSGWSSDTVSREIASYRKDVSNQVHLKGYLTGGSYGYPNYIFTLPTGYRPYNGCEFAVACGSATGTCKLTILQSGEVFAVGGSGELSLNGVSFFTD